MRLKYLEVFPIHTGLLIDSFDPVSSGHLEVCRSALADGSADRVILILSGDPSSCLAPAEDRWQMLTAACSGSKLLIPDLPPLNHSLSGAGDILEFFRKKNPEDRFVLLSADVTDTLPPSVSEYCELKGLYDKVPRFAHAGLWIDQLFEALNPHRFAHSLSVALTSAQLAFRFGLDAVRAEEAGLLHDCAKCFSLSEMQKISRKHHLTDDQDFLSSASLLHSIVGAWTARREYGMEDPEVLEAIMYHNTGCAGMSPLAMCVCLADFIEPNRELFPGLEEVRRLSEVSLEKALLLSLECVAAHVKSGGKQLHPRTLGAIEWLRFLPAVQFAAEPSGKNIKNES